MLRPETAVETMNRDSATSNLAESKVTTSQAPFWTNIAAFPGTRFEMEDTSAGIE
jgi:hypothetical protein